MNIDSYKNDCELIDRLVIITAGLSNDQKLIRRAGIVDTLGGLANTIKELIADRVKKEGVSGTLVSYLGTAALFRWPLIGTLVSIAGPMFGISLGDIFNKTIQVVIGTIQNTGQFTEQDAKRIGSEATKEITSNASLNIIYEFEKQGILTSMMRKDAGIAGLFSRVLGRFGRSSALKLFGGFIKWFLVSVLLGVAAVEGPQLLKNLMTGTSPSGGSGAEMIGVPTTLTNMFLGQQPSAPIVEAPQDIFPNPVSHKYKASGRGETYFPNSNVNQWWIQLVGGNIKRTLLQWTLAIYPELKGKETNILASPVFNRTAYILSSTYKPGEARDWLKIPPSEVHSWKDIVDTFVGDIV